MIPDDRSSMNGGRDFFMIIFCRDSKQQDLKHTKII